MGLLLWIGGEGRDGVTGVELGGGHVAELRGAVVSPLDDGDAADGISPGEVDTCTSAAIKRERVDRF